MIDPINSLAFAVHASPGVYAVLLGSGISRSARIPTGWEITLELVRKLAAVQAENCEPSPEEWYRQKFGDTPGYSELLNLLAKTPTERHQLLRGYWEPNEKEREEGAKLPTEAHRAIASLVAAGQIRVIVTTNFDRLMESALVDSGVVPTVISTSDQALGALPLIHTKCLVLKVHGDYLDTRIRNTPEELDSYPPEINALLDRIFDEFGLIVCGWSADWDTALRNAFYRSRSRRFTTYWASRGKLGQEAQKLFDHRAGIRVEIADADTFFAKLWEQVESLESFARPHPLSTDVAVTTLKRYLSEDRYLIQHADLVLDEVLRIKKASSDAGLYNANGLPLSVASFTARVSAFEGICQNLIYMSVVAGRWARSKQQEPWIQALETLGNVPRQGGTVVWLNLQRYPATLLLYAIGIAAVDAGNLQFVSGLF